MNKLRQLALKMQNINNNIKENVDNEYENFVKELMLNPNNEDNKKKLIEKRKKLEFDAETSSILIFGNRNETDLLYDVEVKETPFGKGVFATNIIPKGELITLFPCDCYERNGDIFFGTHYPKHKCFVTNSIIISGDPENYTPEYCGHLCNDRVMYKSNNLNDESTKNKQIKTYETLSKKLANAELILIGNLFLGIRSKRQIEDGEEIYIHYGIKLWDLFNNSE